MPGSTATNTSLRFANNKSLMGADLDALVTYVDLKLFGTNTVTQSTATPAFDANLGAIQVVAMTQNATGPTVTNGHAGQILTFRIVQNASAAKTWAWPANVKGGGTISATLSSTNNQVFRKVGTNWEAVSAMVSF